MDPTVRRLALEVGSEDWYNLGEFAACVAAESAASGPGVLRGRVATTLRALHDAALVTFVRVPGTGPAGGTHYPPLSRELVDEALARDDWGTVPWTTDVWFTNTTEGDGVSFASAHARPAVTGDEAYSAAWAEWLTSPDADLWESVVGDGIEADPGGDPAR